MTRIAVVGDGPGGMSAALFLARAGHDVAMHGDDTTAMHYALLRNYLGIHEITGSEFQEVARFQVSRYGARITGRRVSAVAASEGEFTLTLDDGSEEASDYVILAEGRNPEIAVTLGLSADASGAIVVDSDQRTSLERVYAVGRATRPGRSQAIISAGAGAVAALDILAVETGGDVTDWDSLDA